MLDRQKLLSVIIPAHRQAQTIVKDIKRIEKVLSQIRYDFEMIVVVDGYGDGTYRAANKVKSQKVKTYVYKKNLGKGWALRFGMGKAKGDYVAFIDAGMEIDPNGLSMLLEHLEWYDADIIVGSKRHPASYVEYPFLRKVLSWVYYLLVRILFGFRVHDTQAGIKIFKRKVLEVILPRLLIKRYALDVEILAVANHLGFRRIYEAPIRIRYGFGDTLTSSANLKTIMGMLLDTAAIFYRLYIRRYYDGRNWRQWKKFNELYRT